MGEKIDDKQGAFLKNAHFIGKMEEHACRCRESGREDFRNIFSHTRDILNKMSYLCAPKQVLQ